MKIVLDDNAIMPTKSHENDAGYDLYATRITVIPGWNNAEIDTGVHIEIPEGYYGLVTGRSGLNFKHDVICPQGTIDSGYTGSIRVKLYNMSGETFMALDGDRIAQIIFLKCETVKFEQVETLDDTLRGSNGFGSTGL